MIITILILLYIASFIGTLFDFLEDLHSWDERVHWQDILLIVIFHPIFYPLKFLIYIKNKTQ